MTDLKRPRGRPPTGEAMTDAEKQRAYRQRRAQAIAELERELEQCREQLHLEYQKNMELATEIDSLNDKIAVLRARK